MPRASVVDGYKKMRPAFNLLITKAKGGLCCFDFSFSN